MDTQIEKWVHHLQHCSVPSLSVCAIGRWLFAALNDVPLRMRSPSNHPVLRLIDKKPGVLQRKHMHAHLHTVRSDFRVAQVG